MKILITGAGGLIGSALVFELQARGDTVVLARRDPKETCGPGDVEWNTNSGEFDTSKLAGLDAVVHLGGTSIGAHRWNEQVKARISESRILGTRQIVKMLTAKFNNPVRFLSASAIGFYGDRGEERLEETSSSGSGYLSSLVSEWEREARGAEAARHSVALLRSGIVLDKHGGALQKQLTLFKLGAGAILGSGNQWMSWIHLKDEVAAIVFLLENPQITGAVNLVAPEPVRNRDYSHQLGNSFSKPVLLKAPAFALKAALGAEMATELLLSSQRVVPTVLSNAGFKYNFSDLKGALANLVAS